MMNYNRHRLRQQIIDQLIKQAQEQRLLSIQSGRDDPFQVYYYPTPLDDPFQIQKLEEKIKGKFVQQANIAKMVSIKQQLDKQLYIVNQQIIAEKYESQTIDMMIQQLQNKIKKQKIRKQISNERSTSRKQMTHAVIQTQKPILKDASISYEPSYQTKKEQKLKKSNIFSTQIYSITIKSQQKQEIIKQTNIKKEIVEQKQKMKRQQKTKQNNKYNENAVNQTKIKASANPKIQQIYQDLQKQMRYMQHLKRSNHKKQYTQQKQKVKFMIQLFWKYAQNQKSDSVSDISLPFFEL